MEYILETKRLDAYNGYCSMMADFADGVLIDANCFTEKVEWRAVRQINKPNSHRPVFRKVIIKQPAMYSVGRTVFCHPALAEKMKTFLRRAQQRIEDRMDAMVFGALATLPGRTEAPVLFDKMPPVVDPSTLPFTEDNSVLTFNRFYWDMFSVGVLKGPSHIDLGGVS